MVTNEQVLKICSECRDKTDEQLSQELNLPLSSVARTRLKKCGIKRAGGGQSRLKTVDPKTVDPVHPYERDLNSDLATDKGKEEWFREQFLNSKFYQQVKQQFTQDEVELYLEEWGALCVQFEDVVATEKRQIDEFIKLEIMENRLLKNVKITEDEIGNVIEEIETLRKGEVEDDITLQKRDQELIYLVNIMAGQAKSMGAEHLKLINAKNDILEQLNARRKDRIDHIKNTKTSFLGFVELLNNKEVRDIQMRRAELIRMAKDKKLKDWRSKNLFPDGTVDPYLIDSETVTNSDRAIDDYVIPNVMSKDSILNNANTKKEKE
jgi:hypothetical protein